MPKDSYEDHVVQVEDHAGIGPFGFRASTGSRIDGKDAFHSLEDEWKTVEGRARLEGRTPVALDRDRILYSDSFRRQDDKFQVLFLGATRLRRTYTSHATKVSQVVRSVANRLALNADLAEGIVLGSKVGGVPFLHVGKVKVQDWMRSKVADMDVSPDIGSKGQAQALFNIGANGEMTIPSWIETIRSPELRERVMKFVPWAAGSPSFPAYASGPQSYWMLTLNPFTLSPAEDSYLAQTMYGVWRHSLEDPRIMTNSDFLHSMTFGTTARSISQSNLTHEAILVRYCDDITWTLENLGEASRVAALDNAPAPFDQLARTHEKDFPENVRVALFHHNSGALYTYFIDDIVQNSRRLMADAGGSVAALEKEPIVEMSETGMQTLERMKQFLGMQIFKNDRMLFRTQTLEGITLTALDVLYRSHEGELPMRIERLARLGGWAQSGELDDARERLRDSAHRIQVAVTVMAAMSDREVFELVGLE